MFKSTTGWALVTLFLILTAVVFYSSKGCGEKLECLILLLPIMPWSFLMGKYVLPYMGYSVSLYIMFIMLNCIILYFIGAEIENLYHQTKQRIQNSKATKKKNNL